jgi:hypothetical protein
MVMRPLLRFGGYPQACPLQCPLGVYYKGQKAASNRGMTQKQKFFEFIKGSSSLF